MVIDTSENTSAIVDFVYFFNRLKQEKRTIEIPDMAVRINDSYLIHYRALAVEKCQKSRHIFLINVFCVQIQPLRHIFQT